MKNASQVLFAIATVVLVTSTSAVSFAAGKTTADKVKKETVEAVDAAGTYAGEKKEEFAARMKGNLDQLDREIEELKAESQTKSVEVRNATKRKISELQAKRDLVNKRYAELEKSTGKAWTTMKTGVEKAWGDVRNAYGEAKSELSSKK